MGQICCQPVPEDVQTGPIAIDEYAEPVVSEAEHTAGRQTECRVVGSSHC